MKFNFEKLEQAAGAGIGTVILAIITWPVLEYGGVLDKLREISMQFTKVILEYISNLEIFRS